MIIFFSDRDDIRLESKLTKGIEKLQQDDCHSANLTAFLEDGREVLIDKARPQWELDCLF